MKHVYLIGIGGSGLSAIARLLLERGLVVSGSDRQASKTTEALQAAGARVHIGHRAESIREAEIVVRSSAIPDDHVEVRAALERGIPVLKRAEFLGRLLEGYLVIAVAGTHGKTTTTAMISWILSSLGQDPSFIIGGESRDLATNAHAGRGKVFVIEADEYDHMFLGLTPNIAVVTNVEHDHPDCYPTADEFYRAFLEFARRLAPEGILLGCLDDPGARRLMQEVRSWGYDVRAYGMNHWLSHSGPEYSGRGLKLNQQGGFSFEMIGTHAASQLRPIPVALQVPGRHNASNALATLAVIDCLAFPVDQAAYALGDYHGVGRRFEVRGEAGGVTVIDDYAHHPSEIRATLAAARSRFPGGRLWAVWQPHTYSRTRALLSDFARCFEDADVVLITEIFAAREAPPPDGFSSTQVLEAIVHRDAQIVSSFSQAADRMVGRLQAGDVVLVLSAGDADQISELILQNLGQKEGARSDSNA